MYILVGSGLFNLVAIVPFPYFSGATGASISIHLSEFIVTATMGFLFWRAETLRRKAARSSISSSPARVQSRLVENPVVLATSEINLNLSGEATPGSAQFLPGEAVSCLVSLQITAPVS
jgi:O-antigen/teichoic acid export membrane protein